MTQSKLFVLYFLTGLLLTGQCVLAETTETLYYTIYFYGLPVGEAKIVSIEENGNMTISLTSKSRNLAEVMVPFRLQCTSIHDIGAGHSLQYVQKSKFKKTRDDFLTLRYDNGYFIFMIVDEKSNLVKKYAHLVDEKVSPEGKKALRIRHLPLYSGLCDPLSFLYRIRKSVDQGKTELSVPLIVDNTVKTVKLSVSSNKKRYFVEPDIDLPGVFPKNSKVQLSIQKDDDRVPGRMDLDIPGIGEFKIKLRKRVVEDE